MSPQEEQNGQDQPDIVAPQQPASPAADIKDIEVVETSKRPMMELLKTFSGDPDLYRAFARDVVAQEVARATFDQDWRLAKVFAISGVFKDITGVTQQAAIATAMAKIQLGRSWNINEADAMQFIYFTNGRPAVMGELFAAKLRDAGYDWDVDFFYEEKGGKRGKCIGCEIWPKRFDNQAATYKPMLDRKGNPVSVSFTKEDADAAMIWEKGKQMPLSQKWNFQSWPEDMYFWRALSRLRRRYATNVLSGVLLREEAEELAPPERPALPARAEVSVAQFTPSKDKNRGHDATMPTTATDAPKEKPAEQADTTESTDKTKPADDAPASDKDSAPPPDKSETKKETKADRGLALTDFKNHQIKAMEMIFKSNNLGGREEIDEMLARWTSGMDNWLVWLKDKAIEGKLNVAWDKW